MLVNGNSAKYWIDKLKTKNLLLLLGLVLNTILVNLTKIYRHLWS
jgi:hypothetical protein